MHLDTRRVAKAQSDVDVVGDHRQTLVITQRLGNEPNRAADPEEHCRVCPYVGGDALGDQPLGPSVELGASIE